MRIFGAIVISFCMLASCAHDQTSKDQGAIKITRSGSQPSRQGLGENFTGSVRVDPLFQAKAPARTSGSLVTFEPGARTAWNSHPLGQVLIVTSGTGRVQR
jgi:4-carboxymuconolactone decarboxylase